VPEYLAPGVYVEEVSFRSKSIEGVGTSTTAFAGPTANGPVGGSPELLTSFTDFERIYGGVDSLLFTGKSASTLNYLAHAARAYFDNGGARLYVARVFGGDAAAILAARAHTKSAPFIQDKEANPTKFGYFQARFPGQWMNGARVLTQQVATPVGGADFLKKQANGSVLRIATGAGDTAKFVIWFKSAGKFQRLKDDGTAEDVPLNEQIDSVKAEALTVNLSVVRDGTLLAEYPGVSAHSASPRALAQLLPADPKNRADQLTQPVAVVLEAGLPTDPVSILKGLVGAQPDAKTKQEGEEPGKAYTFAGGTDGNEPAGTHYETANQIAAGFDLLIGLEDVSIVAAPGYADFGDAQNIQDKLIGHTEKPRRYRIAVLDSPKNQTPSQMRTERGKIDSTRAALYYPWIVASNPLWTPSNTEPREIVLPPSGSVCGIYARNDIQRGVFKAPANEVVRGALRFERDVNFAEQELLNPLGVNCLRYLSGRGYRVWGARTVSSDPEWKYVNVRRYFNYLESSIDRGTQWVVFEPNGELLWVNVRGTISDYLFAEWKTGALLGTKPEEAFFVRCDRSTMTQNDLDNGRLICLIGVAVVKPAEFVIFRIGQKTADAKG
jgi:hypothetical protein